MEEERKAGQSLPPELWGYVIHFLDVPVACGLRLVNREWRSVIDQESFWERRVKELSDYDHGSMAAITSGLTWQELYKSSFVWKWRIESPEKVVNDEEINPKIRVVERNDEFVLTNQRRTAKCLSPDRRPIISEHSITIKATQEPGRRFHYIEYYLDHSNHLTAAGFGIAESDILRNPFFVKENSGTVWFPPYFVTEGNIYTNFTTSAGTAVNNGESCSSIPAGSGSTVSLLLDLLDKRIMFFQNREPIYHWVDVSWIWHDMNAKGETQRKLHAAIVIDSPTTVTLSHPVVPPDVLEQALEITYVVSASE